jgi:hypothetical protein
MLSERAFTTEIRKTQLMHIAEVWEKLYVLEACVEDLMFVRNAFTVVAMEGDTVGEPFTSIRKSKQPSVDKGNKLIPELNDLIQQDRFWLGEEKGKREKGSVLPY